MKREFAFFVIFILVFGCSTSNYCEENSCFTPPPATIFNIVDRDSGEDLFTNGTLNSGNVKLLDENDKNIGFQVFSENDSIFLYLDVGWETGFNSYRLILSPEVEIQFNLISEIKNESCCNFYTLKDLSVTNFSFSQSETTGNYLIFID